MKDFEQRVAAAKRAIRAHSVDGVQRRSFPLTRIEVRDLKDDGSYRFVGHGAVFNSLSENLGGFRETITPGAFTEVLAKGSPDTRALFNHDPNLVLARTGNQTLTIEQDATGLAYNGLAAPTTYARDLYLLLERGDITQSSFAFRVARGGDTWDEDPETGGLIRTINNFSGLYDVSPVTYPAYTAADSGLASRMTEADADTLEVLGQMLALAAQFLDIEPDPADITAMQGVLTVLTGLVGQEGGEASSPTDAERADDGPSAGERDRDGSTVDRQVDDAWRLQAVKRRVRLRAA